MKKRYTALSIALITAVSLSACNGAEVTPAAPTEAPTRAEAGPTEAEAAPTEAPTAAEATPTEAPAYPVSNVPDGIVQLNAQDRIAAIPDNDAMEFTRDMKAGWNLGNAFDAYNCDWLSDPLDYESAWCGAKTTKELIHAIKDAGFNTIRIPVSWHNHLDGSWNIDSRWMDRVQEVVDWAYDEGMYVIINIHHDNEKGFEYPSYDQLDNSKKYISKIWTQIAERFADYDEHLIYETMNEPRQVGTDHEWWINDTSSTVAKECFDCVNQLNQTAVDTIRSVDKGYNTSRYIMCPGYCASPEFELVSDFKLPDDSMASADNRIILSVHAYTPYSFALDMSGTSSFDISKSSSTDDIDSFMRRIYNSYVIKGIPVVISEYGALDKNGNLDSRMQFTAYYVATATHYGMPTILWDNNAINTSGENFQIIDRASLNWSFPEIRDQIIYYCE